MKYPIVMVPMLAVPLWLSGCAGMGPQAESGFLYKNLPIASGSATPGEGHTVTFKGAPLPMTGPGIKVGDTLRDVQVAKGDLSLVNIADTRGRVRIVSIVPSLDTAVCEQQTHHLSEKNKGLDQMVELITISVDTPFAQGRFAKEARIKNVTFLSDYRGGTLAKPTGCLFPTCTFLPARSWSWTRTT